MGVRAGLAGCTERDERWRGTSQVDADEEHGASAFENGVSECGEECGHVVSGGCRADFGLSGEGQQDESAEDLNAIERPADLGRAI